MINENDEFKSFIVIPTHPILIGTKIKNEPSEMKLNKMQFITRLNNCLIYENTDKGLIQVTKNDIQRLFG